MNARTTLVVFLAFAALAVFAWTIRDEPARQVGPNAPTATPGPIWEVAEDGVTALAVVGPSGAYTLTRAGDGWQVDGRAAADDVGTTVQGAAAPTVVRVLGEDRDPDDYGFASPALTLTFTISDVQRVLLVGDQPPTTSDYYVRPAEGGPMRIVSGFEIGRLIEWLTAPPLAPTATPEATETPGEGTPGADGEATDGTPEAGEGTAPAGTVDPTDPTDPTASTEVPTVTSEPTAEPTDAATAAATSGTAMPIRTPTPMLTTTVTPPDGG